MISVKKPSFEIVAHRGAQTLADGRRIVPENTLPAFQEAARLGASIELDVIATRDGHLAVHHDDETGRIFTLPGGDQWVREATWPELQSAVFNRAGHEASVRRLLGADSRYQAPAHFQTVTVPQLETVLNALPQTRFYVELKTDDHAVRRGLNNDLEARVARLIREKNLYDRVTVISFSALSLRKIKRLDPRVRTGLDFRLPAWAGRHPLLLKGYVDLYARRWVGVNSLHPSYDDTSRELVNFSHAAGLPVIPWVSGQTREEEQAMFPRLIAMGVDGLISNAVDLLLPGMA